MCRRKTTGRDAGDTVDPAVPLLYYTQHMGIKICQSENYEHEILFSTSAVAINGINRCRVPKNIFRGFESLQSPYSMHFSCEKKTSAAESARA